MFSLDRSPRPRWQYVTAAFVLFGIEVLIATKLRHRPWIRGTFGDVLVVGLLYAAGMALWPTAWRRVALSVLAIAFAIEGAQYLKLAAHLGLGGPWRFILGATFSWEDLLAYTAGTLVAVLTDAVLPGRYASAKVA